MLKKVTLVSVSSTPKAALALRKFFPNMTQDGAVANVRSAPIILCEAVPPEEALDQQRLIGDAGSVLIEDVVPEKPEPAPGLNIESTEDAVEAVMKCVGDNSSIEDWNEDIIRREVSRILESLLSNHVPRG